MNLFSLFFDILNSASIQYAITGRTEKYPEHIHSDIDIIIPKNQIKDFFELMRNLDKKNIQWIQVLSHEINSFYCIITLGNHTKINILKPDVCSDYYRKGKLFLRADYLLENRKQSSKGFFILSAEKEFIYYLVKKIDKGNINKEQFEHLQSQWEQNTELCKKELKTFFSIKHQQIIIDIFNTKNIALLFSKIKSLQQELHQHIHFSISDFTGRIINRLDRIIKPTGLIVAFMGPDGCGKTTIINGVKNDLSEAFRQYKQYHLFPKEMKQNTVTVTNPQGEKPRGFFASVLKLKYFLALYTLGYWCKIYPLKIKSSLIVFDRYYHDILIDSLRYRNTSGSFITSIIGKMIPKPDIWILLDAPAKIIQERKSEVSMDETMRQREAYRQLFVELKNAHIINANQPIEQVTLDVESIIIEHMRKKISNRY